MATGGDLDLDQPDPADVAWFRARRDGVLARIAAAARRSGREPAAVRLVAVSKTVAVERLRAAVAAGLTVLGENRVQEGEAKRPMVPGASWELIGPLQSNKARRALETYDLIESVDSLDLAGRLDRLADDAGVARVRVPVLLQANVDDDPAKAGFAPAELEAALAALLDLPRLRVDGLMTVGRQVDDPEAARPTFRRLRELAARLRTTDPRLGADLSMGMSADFEVAIEEGATIVRVGRALFGERPPAEAPTA
ncbi:MAG TPA: YggS family pyridoxal phosphate-dependent enzyme [Candidatus Limnocylindrales bacterium]|nr:YggS family pyridoxal phosphate-dependent enzyme [Candidatus Limnocylindrales bacterium]